MGTWCGSHSFCLGYLEAGKQAFMAEVTFEPILERLVEFHWARDRERAFQASTPPEQRCGKWRAWGKAEKQGSALGTTDGPTGPLQLPR